MKLNISIPEYEKYSVKYGYESIERSKAKFDSLPFLYRADTRAPEVIKHNGFIARNPLKLEDAKELVKKIFCCDASILFSHVSCGADSIGNIFVSTADTPDCMGHFTKENIYVISTEDIHEVHPSKEVLGEAITRTTKNGLRLYLNAKTLEETTFIGIRPYEYSGEIIVLTPIPANQVLGVGNAKDFNSFVTFD
ncbi:hypothetical protein NNC58_14150 [Prevotella copri]|uniref:Uncharacterized protein n=1 Tax=Segatella copri TaxID=165179 RepID=A0AAW5IP35_9BACT|nr:hypothetical protein [Segatella copri]MCP9535796.1 hypothetical protein [Segatella copri]MCP9538700.1 hypothetical protein [Segatella copri]MCP9541641.1 hypothetical protein [Segatella copri]MCP9559954.1 hypothetical protein [Segatella copri]MCP9562791.1 hypothetical protein [Segatella copri]